MVKGDTALDMRGRCSAGQKVMALHLQYTITGILKTDSHDCRGGSSKSNLLLSTTSCHSVWVLHNMWMNILTLLWAAKTHCFRWAPRLMPCRSEGFDFPLTSCSSPPILSLPSYHWGYLSFRSVDLLPPLFFFLLSPWSSFCNCIYF